MNSAKQITKTVLIFIILLTGITKINAQAFEWAKGIGGISYDGGNCITVDASGNVYTTGYFDGTADFDPGVGIFNLTAAGSYAIFVSKLDSFGNFIWALNIGSPNKQESYSIDIDCAGNVYITGIFQKTMDFDPDTPIFNLTSNGGDDIFIAKYSSLGKFIWAKQIGGVKYDYCISIRIDNAYNVYTAGNFIDTVDFDPGLGYYSLIALPGAGDCFVSKLDSNGSFIWAKQFHGKQGVDCNSMDIDDTGNVYTTGSFRGKCDFDPGIGKYNLTSIGVEDIFVSKLDSAGNFIWAKRMGGMVNDVGHSIAVDDSGNVITTGQFGAVADLDPGLSSYNLTAFGNNWSTDLFISKLDHDGNFLWAKAIGGYSNCISNSISTDGLGNIYTTGYFENQIDFDPSLGVFNLNSSSYSDIFILKLFTSGNFFWAKQMGGIDQDLGISIAVDALENIFTTGQFRGISDFDPGIGTYNLIAVGQYDIFISKLNNLGSAVSEVNSTNNFNLFPNPTTGNITVDLAKNYNNIHVIVKNIIGQEIFIKKYSGTNRIDLNIDAQPGLYFIELKTDDERLGMMKVMKQ